MPEKKSGTCVLKVHKNLGTCFFFLFFFGGGRGQQESLFFVVCRECSLQLLDPSRTLKTDSKGPWKDVIIKGKDLLPITISLSLFVTFSKGTHSIGDIDDIDLYNLYIICRKSNGRISSTYWSGHPWIFMNSSMWGARPSYEFHTCLACFLWDVWFGKLGYSLNH